MVYVNGGKALDAVLYQRYGWVEDYVEMNICATKS